MPLSPEQLAALLAAAPKTRQVVASVDGVKEIDTVSITTDLQCAIVRELFRAEEAQRGAAA